MRVESAALGGDDERVDDGGTVAGVRMSRRSPVSISSVVPVGLVAITNSLPPPVSNAYEVPGRLSITHKSAGVDLHRDG